MKPETPQMSLSTGSRLGAYEIVAPLGRGGMGEVYRARDTRLDRTVAIKIIRDGTAGDLKARFEREARVVSSLTHPHICALYDVGFAEAPTGADHAVDFLVMEHVEGETLAARLLRGPLPVADAVRYAEQMAEALDHAHRRGVVHRDLKPSNVMLTKAGAKLLDFGLAKVRGTMAARVESLTVSTRSMQSGPLTDSQVILGTVRYMAPEQLKGGHVDGRTDLFALGLIVYEMVAGRAPFEADSKAGLIAAILEHEPPRVSTVRSDVPPALDRIVAKCLAKDPDSRRQTARDLADDLQWLLDDPLRETATQAPSRKALTPRRLLWTAALIAILALGAALSLRSRATDGGPKVPATRLLLPLDPGLREHAAAFAPGALSRDGSLWVFPADDVNKGGHQHHLYLRAMNALESRVLPGTRDAIQPFFSPDAQWVGFWTEGAWRRVSLTGGPTQIVATTGLGPHGATWSNDGTIVYSTPRLGRSERPDRGSAGLQ